MDPALELASARALTMERELLVGERGAAVPVAPRAAAASPAAGVAVRAISFARCPVAA